jgi:hypothetical protein
METLIKLFTYIQFHYFHFIAGKRIKDDDLEIYTDYGLRILYNIVKYDRFSPTSHAPFHSSEHVYIIPAFCSSYNRRQNSK